MVYAWVLTLNFLRIAESLVYISLQVHTYIHFLTWCVSWSNHASTERRLSCNASYYYAGRDIIYKATTMRLSVHTDDRFQASAIRRSANDSLENLIQWLSVVEITSEYGFTCRAIAGCAHVIVRRGGLMRPPLHRTIKQHQPDARSRSSLHPQYFQLRRSMRLPSATFA